MPVLVEGDDGGEFVVITTSCRRRRNLLTFSEMTKLYLTVVFYIHLESSVFLLIYNFQDRIGPDNVFYIIHTLYAVFDFSLLVCVRPN